MEEDPRVFTALHCMPGSLVTRKLSVLPSVRLSVKRVICDKTKENCAHI